MAALLGLDRDNELLQEEHEEAELLAVMMPNTADARDEARFPPPTETTIATIRAAHWYGQPNRLSREHVVWPVIDEVAAATRMPQELLVDALPPELVDHCRPSGTVPDVDGRRIIHQRRSCLALDGRGTISRDVFLQMVARTLPGRPPPGTRCTGRRPSIWRCSFTGSMA